MAEAESGKSGAPQQRGNPWARAGRILGITWCLLSMGTGAVLGHFYWNSAAIRGMLGRSWPRIIGDVFRGRPLDNWTPDRQFPGQTAFNVLVLGADRDWDDYGRQITSTHGRSDSILIVRVDFAAKTVRALTIPRDTAVHIPGHRGIHKINAAHAFGGPDLTVDTIKQVLGITIDAYVTIDIQGFVRVVDALGGIDLNIEKRLKYDDNWGHLHINLFPGYQHLTGYQAMGYVRMRHSDSDEMRSKRQHAFLEALRTKIKSPSTFGVLPELLDKIRGSLKVGRLTDEQLFTLANFARSLPRENVEVETLPSEEGPSYVTIYTEKSEALIQRMFGVTYSIDAPDPGSVRSMNSRYDGSGRRGRRGQDGAETPVGVPADPADIQPPIEVEPPPPDVVAPEGSAEPATPPAGKPADKPAEKPDEGPADKPAPAAPQTSGGDTKPPVVR